MASYRLPEGLKVAPADLEKSMRYNRSQLKLIFSILTVIAICCATTGSAVADIQVAFNPGERLLFQLKWGFIPAGQAVLEVLPFETVKGVKSFHFVMEARTNAFIDKIYRYRSRIDAYADVDMTRSVMYRKRTEAGRSVKDIQVLFDWEKREALYRHEKSTRDQPGEVSTLVKRTILMPGTFDPLSVFYYTRLVSLGDSLSFSHPVTDGKECVVATADIIKRVNIRVDGMDYDTLLLEPDLKHLEGVFHKKKGSKISIWVTADKRRIPVKIRSRVTVGSFTGELVAIENPENLALNKRQVIENKGHGF
jgi:hypothetical protein